MFVGFSLGLTGGGGAIFAVPLLVYGLAVDPRDPVRVLQLALTLVDDAEATEGKIRRHTNAGRSITAAQVQAAIDDGIINDLERVRLQEFQHLLDAAIAVDQFEKTSQRTRNSAGDS
jgi:hypothetical protein